LALFLANALHGAIRNSAVCDELGAHIPAGYLYWTSGRFSGGIDNFPLAQLIIALPVKLSGCSYELFTEQHLFLFRLPVLLMGVALALVVYCFASDLYNELAGLAALFLFALSPNMVAHASLATLDLATAFFIFLATYLLYRYVERPNIGRVLAFSLALSAAIVTKVQALGVIPIALLALVVFLRTMMPASSREKLLFFASWLIIPVTAYAVINLVYLHLPTSTGDWLPAQFVEALKGKLLHSERGHFAYLFGEYSDKGWLPSWSRRRFLCWCLWL
jgi:predicted membrane-bound dolichyl-phosphate-mannose-protein mannosyltransferase